jgi:hypothetical protein
MISCISDITGGEGNHFIQDQAMANRETAELYRMLVDAGIGAREPRHVLTFIRTRSVHSPANARQGMNRTLTNLLELK